MDRNKGTNRKKDGDTAADVAAKQVEAFTSAYGTEDGETTANPFCRRSSLARTPPPTRPLPSEGLIEGGDKGRGEDKRKRSEDSPAETAKKPREATVPGGDAGPEICRSGLLRKAAHLIQKVDEDVGELYKITSGSRNTKVEIKDLAENLLNLMKELTSVDLRVMGERKEEEHEPETRVMSTQTEQRGGLRTKRTDTSVQLMTLEACPTVEQWHEVKDRKWSPNLYTRTEVKDGKDILATKDSVVKVVISLKDDSEPRNKGIRERYPELWASSDDYAVLEQISNLRGGNDSTSSRKIIKINTDGSNEDLWAKLVKVREEVGPDSWVAVQQVPGRSVGPLRKMLECVFLLQTSVRVAIYTDSERPQKRTQRGQEKQKKERDTCALVVESSGGETYTDVLRRVKERVRNSSVGNKIKGLRSTRDGRLLITTDKDPTAADRVAEILGEPTQQLKVRKTGQRGRELALHIRGLDALTSKQDIVEAVEGRIGPLTGKIFRISELRPNAGNTLAATFVTSKEDAIKVMGDGTLRIGLVDCRVEKRLDIERCFRCWSYEHKARDCDGVVDRSRLCYRCGAEGHSAKVCDKEEACPVCGVGGHTADSRQCRFFKRALAQAREAERQKASRDIRAGEERQLSTRLTSSETNEPTRGPGPTGALEPLLIS